MYICIYMCVYVYIPIFIYFILCKYVYVSEVSKVGDTTRRWPEGSLFDSNYTKV